MGRHRTGIAPPTGLAVNPSQYPRGGAKSPGMAARWLLSCGLTSRALNAWGDGWLFGSVADRTTGESKGMRWIRPRREGGGYEVRSERPL